jgi:hypothetical protein
MFLRLLSFQKISGSNDADCLSRTENWVSEGVVSLYTAAGRQPPLDWTLRYTGVPVLLLDLGGSRSRCRGVRLVLAERDSGLALWYDTLDNLSSYEAQASVFK